MNEGYRIETVLSSDKPTLSFEFFPPKDEAGSISLRNSINELMKVKPNFASVTYGAMGSNQDSSIAVVEHLSRLLPTVAHLTCIGATKSGIGDLLQKYQEFGVAGILALRGDKPRGVEDFPKSDYKFALDLVEQVRESTSLSVGVAAFPEKHPESKSLEEDVKVLRMKQDAGASFAMTQLFFDLDAYVSLVERARSAGVTIPIIPGVMPIANVRQVLRMAEMSGAAVPSELEECLNLANNEDEARIIGMNYSVGLVKSLVSIGVPGVHIFTLNQHRAALQLVEEANLA